MTNASCPYCGAAIIAPNASFCDECHKALPSAPPGPSIDIKIDVGKVEGGGAVRGVVFEYDRRPEIEAESRAELQARRALLDRMSVAYIDGKLHQQEGTFNYFAPGKGLFQLHKRLVPDALDPSTTTLDDLVYQKRPELLRIPPEKPISDIFTDYNGSLLILGAPGSGKTVALLSLARSIVNQAREDTTCPIPVVLELDTWQVRPLSLIDWIISEVRSSKYGISADYTRKWIQNGQLLLLLDGLDQVIPERREDCVRAINEFLGLYGGNRIAITCRSEEYALLQVRLKLQGAILLEPLTRQQVEDYFLAASIRLEGLYQAVQSDPKLQEMVKTPLMLTVTSLAYEDTAAYELIETQALPTAQRAGQLFADYVKRMFHYGSATSKTFSDNQTKHWLSWLARQLDDHHLTTLWIEQLQPSWLPSARLQWAYMLISRLTVALIGGIIGGILIGLAGGFPNDLLKGFIRGIVEGTVGGVVAGLVVGTADMIWVTYIGPSPQVRWFNQYVQSAIKLLVIAAVTAISVALILQRLFEVFVFLDYHSSIGLDEGISVGLVFGLSAGLLFAFGPRGMRSGLTDDIQTVEQLSWSEGAAFRWGLVGLGIGAVAGAMAGAFSRHTGLVYVFVQKGLTTSEIMLVTTAIGIFFLGLVGAVFGGLSGTRIQSEKVAPNQGLRLSIANALIYGPLIGLLFVIMGGLAGWLAGGMKYAGTYALYGAFIGLLAAFWWGGVFSVQHLTLRILLALKGSTPHLAQLVIFLDYCAQITFLRKVGGGYQFFHSYIQQYFASLFDTPAN
jgi:eukaryotic-like serine/threonine-protein kinase